MLPPFPLEVFPAINRTSNSTNTESTFNATLRWQIWSGDISTNFDSVLETTTMKTSIKNLLGVIFLGLLLSGLFALSMYANQEREQTHTRSSSQYSMISVSGRLVVDAPKIGIPGTVPPFRHRLVKDGKKTYLLDFSGEPNLQKFAEDNSGTYITISGIKRSVRSEAPDGTAKDWEVISVIEVKAVKSR